MTNTCLLHGPHPEPNCQRCYVQWLKSMRTLTQEEVAERTHEHDQYDPTAQERFEAHANFVG